MTEPLGPAGPDGATPIETLHVTVRHFAVLREQRGRSEEQVEVPAGTTVSQLYRRLFPPGPDGVMPVLFALDQCYVSRDAELTDGLAAILRW